MTVAISAACADSYADVVMNAIGDILDSDPHLSERITDGDEAAEALCARAERSALRALVTAYPVVIRATERTAALSVARTAAAAVIDEEVSQ
jgi:hypothetical protein